MPPLAQRQMGGHMCVFMHLCCRQLHRGSQGERTGIFYRCIFSVGSASVAANLYINGHSGRIFHGRAAASNVDANAKRGNGYS
jgi:hypothetical protein